MNEYSHFLDNHVQNRFNDVITKEELCFYITYLLVNFCMPTLLRIKPSNLINVFKKHLNDTVSFFGILAEELEPFNSSYTILYENDFYFILLIYNEDQVERIINLEDNRRFLTSCGYFIQEGAIHNTLHTLQCRYEVYKVCSQSMTGNDRNSLTCQYPHEIGIILGFPIKDVKDFINYSGKNYIYCGAWKVYHNLEAALKIFESYQIVRENAIRTIQSGKKLQDINNLC